MIEMPPAQKELLLQGGFEIVLVGPCATGKSQFAYWVANALAESNGLTLQRVREETQGLNRVERWKIVEVSAKAETPA